MKRDMDLVRLILLELEKRETTEDSPFLPINGYAPEVVAEHCNMMYQYGLIQEFNVQKTFSGYGFWSVSGITWEGYDYLDKIRDDSTWKKTKDVIVKKGLPLVFDTIKTVSSAFVTAAAEGVANAILKNGGQI